MSLPKTACAAVVAEYSKPIEILIRANLPVPPTERARRGDRARRAAPRAQAIGRSGRAKRA